MKKETLDSCKGQINLGAYFSKTFTAGSQG